MDRHGLTKFRDNKGSACVDMHACVLVSVRAHDRICTLAHAACFCISASQVTSAPKLLQILQGPEGVIRGPAECDAGRRGERGGEGREVRGRRGAAVVRPTAGGGHLV